MRSRRLPSTNACSAPRLGRGTSNASPPPAVGFAAKTRLPTLFRFLAGYRRRLDSTACSGSSPVRALGHATFVDFCHRIRSASTVVGLSKPMSAGRRFFAVAWDAWSLVIFRTPLREQSSPETRESSLLGSGVLFEQQGTRCLDALRTRWLASEALPQSNPRSDTSCRAGHGCAAWRSLAGDRGAPTNPPMN